LEATVMRLRDALAPLILTQYENGETRVPDLDQLVLAASEAKSLAGFLTELALDPPSSTTNSAAPHSSKTTTSYSAPSTPPKGSNGTAST
jgi:hypothetical protein